MMQWERGRVQRLRSSWPGVDQFEVALEPDDTGGPTGTVVRALAYTELLGRIEPGERVLLNTNALRRGLGTGGDGLVVARVDVLPRSEHPTGHMVKARYTPVQTLVDAIDDPASPHYETVRDAEDLGGMPVVLADLHSSLPAIVAGIRLQRPDARICYILTDGAALPAAYSRTVATLREHDLLSACISTGQAFGGDLEAVTVHSALLGARHVIGADVTVVAQGPGNLGTGTGWGFSGMQAVDALHATAVLAGRPIGALRVSSADARSRHRGLSHHTATTFGRAALAPADLVLPAVARDPAPTAGRGVDLDQEIRDAVDREVLAPARARGVEHRVRTARADGIADALEALPVRLSTMGRGLSEDPEAFVYAALAGRYAASGTGR